MGEFLLSCEIYRLCNRTSNDHLELQSPFPNYVSRAEINHKKVLEPPMLLHLSFFIFFNGFDVFFNISHHNGLLSFYQFIYRFHHMTCSENDHTMMTL